MRGAGLCWLLLLLVVLFGCSGGDGGTHLLSVQNFSPRHVDLGDRVELVGAGFPEGRAATVTFRGELRRPGAAPREARIVANAAAASPDRVSITIDRALQSEFCGPADAAQHTTFQGDVTVAFAPRRAGSPPVTGVLHDVLLDVEAPAPSHAVARLRDAESRRALAFLGLDVAAEPSSDRLRIEAVRRGSPAERAGLLVSDTLLSIDGVSIYAPGDVVPARGTRLSRVVVRRGRLAQPLEQRVEVAGFHSAAPIELLPAAVALSVPALLLLLRSRLGLALAFVTRLAASRLGARRAPAERWRPRQAFQQQLAVPHTPAAPYLVFLAVSAAFTVLAFGQHLIAPDLDLGLALLGATTALVVLTLLAGGLASGTAFSLRAAFAAAGTSFGHQLPALLAVFACVGANGSLRLRDAVGAQGAWPWEWRAFDGPLALLAVGLALLALVPATPRSGPRWLQSTLALAAWANLLVLVAVLVCLFLGGWQVPVADSGAARPWGRAAGAALLQLKCGAIVTGILFVRWLAPGVNTGSTRAWCWRRAVPVAAGCLGATVLWSQSADVALARELEPGARWMVLGMLAAACAVSVLQLRRALLRKGDAGSLRPAQGVMPVNPWL